MNLLEYKTKTSLILPFKGIWYIDNGVVITPQQGTPRIQMLGILLCRLKKIQAFLDGNPIRVVE